MTGTDRAARLGGSLTRTCGDRGRVDAPVRHEDAGHQAGPAAGARAGTSRGWWRATVVAGALLVLGCAPSPTTDVGTGPGFGAAGNTFGPTRSTSPTPRPANVPTLDRAAVVEAREHWRAHRPERYVWSYHEACFCSIRRRTVTVDGDRIVGVTSEDRTLGTEAAEQGETVDQVFDRLETSIEDPTDTSVRAVVPGIVKGSFDPEIGYPLVIEIIVGVPDGGDEVVTDEFTPR